MKNQQTNAITKSIEEKIAVCERAAAQMQEYNRKLSIKAEGITKTKGDKNTKGPQ